MPTILLVDDEPMLRSMLAHALQLEGYRTLAAANAVEALALARSQCAEIELLVSETHLPHGSGPDLAAALLEENPALEVLLLADPDLSLPDRFDVITKPFPLNEFLLLVRTLLSSVISNPTKSPEKSSASSHSGEGCQV